MKHYIDKSALVAEIKRILSAFENSDAPVDRLRASTLIALLSFIDTLEVKEIDSNDAFVEKALAYLNEKFYFNNLHYAVENNTFNCIEEMFDDFRNYMKGE